MCYNILWSGGNIFNIIHLQFMYYTSYTILQMFSVIFLIMLKVKCTKYKSKNIELKSNKLSYIYVYLLLLIDKD